MPRKPRVQFPGAIYHIVTRGDGRREVFHDARHYERFTEGLEAEVLRSNWQVIAFCWMPNHVHVVLKTPEPNLTRRSRAFSLEEIIMFVATEHGVNPASYVGFRSQSPGREIAALLCRQLTCATLAELSTELGLRHPDSSANLVRRAKRKLKDSKTFESRVEKLKSKLLKTENQV